MKEEEVNKLMDSFLQHGLNRFEYSNGIPLCVPPMSLKPDTFMPMNTFTQQGKDFSNEQLPTLEFVDNTSRILAAGGAHRVAALSKYLNRCRQLVLCLNHQLKNSDGEDDDETRRARKNIVELGGVLKYHGKWLVILYDLGGHIAIIIYVVSQTTQPSLQAK